ncbi:hypothetical protein DSM106972_078780 [Dulcicalothrix desertica PCC 7102]|uniref:PIN domain-containing protein n=1 Tax=Dulcicalothrix desertica PCC 7102 TaxID=232991 RepID=A0A3S1CA82_9CYAN|nr:hypothetical protein [Dulcicalothrix desertica]RUS99176.1 hypothetical protein DSM106972_078780 [Dulcicalothrix desertica PCC 7102]TWH61029.1 hypothetical protein CAL7102_01106 [Dulcicalothrix desertica PCC 7102]
MAVNLNIQADIIDIQSDIPRKEDIFIVDTNVWFWQGYQNAASTIRSGDSYKLTDYPNYLTEAVINGATLTYSGLTLAELAHIIEKNEYKIYRQSHPSITSKEYRHNYPEERLNVVAEVEKCWEQVKDFAVPVNLNVNDETTDAALNRFKTQALDGYDLLILEAISQAGAGNIKVITDDIDYAVVPGIQVFTSRRYIIEEAARQSKLQVRV